MIKARPAALYHAIVDPNALIRWLPPSGMKGHVDAFEPREGGGYQITLT